MNRNVRLTLVLLTLLTLPLWVGAQQSGHQHGHSSATAVEKPDKGPAENVPPHEEPYHGRHGGMEQCKEMMARHDKMVEEMKSMDARLEEKLAVVRSAGSTDEKAAALEGVVVELSMQRKRIHALMGDMHHAGMRCGMMGAMHMSGKDGKRGGHHGDKSHSGRCPMMEHHKGHGEPSSQEPKGDAG